MRTDLSTNIINRLCRIIYWSCFFFQISPWQSSTDCLSRYNVLHTKQKQKTASYAKNRKLHKETVEIKKKISYRENSYKGMPNKELHKEWK